MDEERWEAAYSASGMVNASIVAGRLETAGVPTRLKYEVVGTIYGLTVDGLGEVRVLVPAHLMGEARDILAQPYDEADMDWAGT